MARHTQSGYSRSNVTGTRSFPSRRGPFIEGVSPLTRYNLDKHTRATRNDHGRHDKVDLYLMSLPHYFAEPTVPPKAVAVDEDEGSTTSPAHPVEGLYSAFSDANRPAPLDRKMGMSHRTTFGHAGTDMVVDGLAFAGGTFDFERPPRHDVTADRNSPERFDGPSIEQLVHVAHQKEEERKEREARAKELERSLRRQVEAERLAEQKENRRKKEKPTGKTHMATDAQGAENMKKTEPVRKAESKKRRRRQVDSDTDSERAAILANRKERRRAKAEIVKDRTKTTAAGKKAGKAVRKATAGSDDGDRLRRSNLSKRRSNAVVSISSQSSVEPIDEAPKKKRNIDKDVHNLRKASVDKGAGGPYDRASNIGPVSRVTVPRQKSGIYNRGHASKPAKVNSNDQKGMADLIFDERPFLDGTLSKVDDANSKPNPAPLKPVKPRQKKQQHKSRDIDSLSDGSSLPSVSATMSYRLPKQLRRGGKEGTQVHAQKEAEDLDTAQQPCPALARKKSTIPPWSARPLQLAEEQEMEQTETSEKEPVARRKLVRAPPERHAPADSERGKTGQKAAKRDLLETTSRPLRRAEQRPLAAPPNPQSDDLHSAHSVRLRAERRSKNHAKSPVKTGSRCPQAAENDPFLDYDLQNDLLAHEDWRFDLPIDATKAATADEGNEQMEERVQKKRYSWMAEPEALDHGHFARTGKAYVPRKTSIQGEASKNVQSAKLSPLKSTEKSACSSYDSLEEDPDFWAQGVKAEVAAGQMPAPLKDNLQTPATHFATGLSDFDADMEELPALSSLTRPSEPRASTINASQQLSERHAFEHELLLDDPNAADVFADADEEGQGSRLVQRDGPGVSSSGVIPSREEQHGQFTDAEEPGPSGEEGGYAAASYIVDWRNSTQPSYISDPLRSGRASGDSKSEDSLSPPPPLARSNETQYVEFETPHYNETYDTIASDPAEDLMTAEDVTHALMPSTPATTAYTRSGVQHSSPAGIPAYYDGGDDGRQFDQASLELPSGHLADSHWSNAFDQYVTFEDPLPFQQGKAALEGSLPIGFRDDSPTADKFEGFWKM